MNLCVVTNGNEEMNLAIYREFSALGTTPTLSTAEAWGLFIRPGRVTQTYSPFNTPTHFKYITIDELLRGDEPHDFVDNWNT